MKANLVHHGIGSNEKRNQYIRKILFTPIANLRE